MTPMFLQASVRCKYKEHFLFPFNNLCCVQARFGGKPELATAADAEIGQLCKQIELILNHGLKERDSSLGLAVIR